MISFLKNLKCYVIGHDYSTYGYGQSYLDPIGEMAGHCNCCEFDTHESELYPCTYRYNRNGVLTIWWINTKQDLKSWWRNINQDVRHRLKGWKACVNCHELCSPEESKLYGMCHDCEIDAFERGERD